MIIQYNILQLSAMVPHMIVKYHQNQTQIRNQLAFKKWCAIVLSGYIALWGDPNELSIQHHIYIFMQYVDS